MLVMRIVGNNNSNITEYCNIQLLQFNGIVTNYDLEKYESVMWLSLPIKDADFPCYNYLHSVYWVFMTALQVELNLPKENEFSILLDEILLQHLIDFPNCEELHNIPGINEGEMNLTQIAIFKEQKVCTKVTDDAKRVVEKDIANQSESVANHSII